MLPSFLSSLAESSNHPISSRFVESKLNKERIIMEDFKSQLRGLLLHLVYHGLTHVASEVAAKISRRDAELDRVRRLRN
jgi:hypothetical protein